MLTRLHIRNFKRFGDAEVELGPITVLCGPNNSGKTTALQALALWHAGLSGWVAKRGIDSKALKRPGVQINRRDLVSIPVPSTNLLWRSLRTHEGRRLDGRPQTRNVRIEIVVEGTMPAEAGMWSCGLEFDYSGEEGLYCRPLRLSDERNPERMPIPPAAINTKVALLPAMSGLATIEPKIESGRIDVLIGEGQTAQILRNLCYRLWDGNPRSWQELVSVMKRLFGIALLDPRHIESRGEIVMSYRDENSIELDLSACGRGQQQILLLLAYVYANPGALLLLDEPDAHLEILRQREVYNLLTEVATRIGSQVIAASHSEVVLEEAAERDVVVAFVGKPHRLDNRGSQLKKWLEEYPIDHLYRAEQSGWIIYLEGSTDLSILRAFARLLDHNAIEALERPFVHYVANQQDQVRRHFYALREAIPDIIGFALFDRLNERLKPDLGAVGMMWQRKEIENYFCTRDILLDWARGRGDADLFRIYRTDAMVEAIDTIEAAQRALERDIWSPDIKATDEVLDRVFSRYFRTIKQEQMFRKRDYHELVDFMNPNLIDPEIVQKLDAISLVYSQKRPRLD